MTQAKLFDTSRPVTFECPVCGHRQKGYFNRCPNGCQDKALAAIVAEGKAREAARRG